MLKWTRRKPAHPKQHYCIMISADPKKLKHTWVEDKPIKTQTPKTISVETFLLTKPQVKKETKNATFKTPFIDAKKLLQKQTPTLVISPSTCLLYGTKLQIEWISLLCQRAQFLFASRQEYIGVSLQWCSICTYILWELEDKKLLWRVAILV